jgi:hypothetical protein
LFSREEKKKNHEFALREKSKAKRQTQRQTPRTRGYLY